MRNAKDVSVSLYHFMKFIKHFQFSGTFEEVYQDFLEGKGVCIYVYVSFTAKWLKNKANVFSIGIRPSICLK